MPYVTDDDSKAVRRIAEIEQELQEAKAEFDRWLVAGGTPTSAAELAQREREGKQHTDRLQALATALELQRALASAGLHEQERKLSKASPKKMKDFGYRTVTVQFLGGVEVELMARYWCRNQARAGKGKGSYFGLVLLGVCDRTTPALAGEVAQLAAALSSFEDARARLRQMGVDMSVRRITNVAYHFARLTLRKSGPLWAQSLLILRYAESVWARFQCFRSGKNSFNVCSPPEGDRRWRARLREQKSRSAIAIGKNWKTSRGTSHRLVSRHHPGRLPASCLASRCGHFAGSLETCGATGAPTEKPMLPAPHSG